MKKFKIGDKVKIIDTGEIGEIVGADTWGKNEEMWDIRIEKKKTNYVSAYFTDEIELIAQ